MHVMAPLCVVFVLKCLLTHEYGSHSVAAVLLYKRKCIVKYSRAKLLISKRSGMQLRVQSKSEMPRGIQPLILLFALSVVLSVALCWCRVRTLWLVD